MARRGVGSCRAVLPFASAASLLLPGAGEEGFGGGWMLLELTVELVLLLAGSCCISWRGERAGGERKLVVLQWQRKREREGERGCCWGRDKDELELSTLVAGVAVAEVGEDDGFSCLHVIFHLLFFLLFFVL